MSVYDDRLLGARFALLAPEPLPDDWSDVLERAAAARKNRLRPWPHRVGSSRRRSVLVFAVAMLVVAMATASALGVRALLVGTGIVGLAPVEATPSAPRRGELVLEFIFGHSMGDPGRFGLTVYADGRMIWQRLGDHSRTDQYRHSTGLLERRLTPEGVERVINEVVATGLVDRDLHLYGGRYGGDGNGLYYGLIDLRRGDQRVHVTWGDIGGPFASVERELATPEQAAALVRLDERLEDPASWLPESAWTSPEAVPFVPWGYSVCFGGYQSAGLSEVLALLPPAAEDVLRSRERRRNEGPAYVYWCSDITSAEARSLTRILDRAGLTGHEDVFGVTYGAYERETGPGEFVLTFTPLFPDEAEGGGIR